MSTHAAIAALVEAHQPMMFLLFLQVRAPKTGLRHS